MIIEDLALIKKIFSIIDISVIDGYDYFRFEAKAGDSYVDMQLTVGKKGAEVTDARADINDAALYDLIKRLRMSAEHRGERWTCFVMSYEQGGQVATKFEYDND